MTAAEFDASVQRGISAMVAEGERAAEASDHDTPAPNAAEIETAAKHDAARAEAAFSALGMLSVLYEHGEIQQIHCEQARAILTQAGMLR